ncbi:hypothetical protein C3L33_08134, partial [Rhododendron williamsianum]
MYACVMSSLCFMFLLIIGTVVLTGSLTNNSTERWVHIDPFSAMNGISRFCEDKFPWRYLDYGFVYTGNMACLCKVLKSIQVYDHVKAFQLVLFAYKIAAGVYLTGEICSEGGGGHRGFQGNHLYCKEEGIPIQEFDQTNFTYLLK